MKTGRPAAHGKRFSVAAGRFLRFCQKGKVFPQGDEGLLREFLLRFGVGWGKIYHEYVWPAAAAGRYSRRELR